ncbi:MAG: ABC transporter ATP-binding protein [Chloroflexi bacterium]|nr:ABC transporter ATP-binding protein [Chloroflexota bacterium]
MNVNTETPIFRIEKLSHTYLGRCPALRDVDLTIRRGEQVVILGANGCGKSTLLKILDGLHRPVSGRIEAFGEDVTGIADDPARAQQFHRRVGLVFQDSDVQLFSATVWDDVAFGPLQLGWTPDEVRRRVQEALAVMGVEDLASRAPFELSGGEKKRVAIATVLAIDPEVLLMDEPTANLDPRSKAVLVDLIAGLGRLGKTIIATTHELDIVPTIASRVIVFGDEERRPIAEGDAQTILDDVDLLVRANLLHQHLHRHGPIQHAHRHSHADEHDHH